MRGDPGSERRQGGELFRPHEASPRTPWLEPEEDEHDDSTDGGLDTGRILAVVLGPLVLLAALAGGAFWLMDAGGDETIVADGSLIKAPEGHYKYRPADRGGAQVEGTGDSSFAVAEGQEREGTIGGEDILGGEDTMGGEDTGEGVGADSGATGVQIGAFPSREEATAAWSRLGVRIPALSGRSHRILEGSADSGSVFRLQAVAGSRADAIALCAAIEADGGDCQVK